MANDNSQNNDKNFSNVDPYSEFQIDVAASVQKSKRNAGIGIIRNEENAAALEASYGFSPESIDDPSQQQHDGVFSKRIKLRFLQDFIESVAKIPTYFPKNFFQQFKLQFFEDKNRLYIYDYINRRWCWAQLNVDEFETTQCGVPNDLIIGDWIGISPGTSSGAYVIANGVFVYTPDNTGYSWINSAMGFSGYLDFNNTKQVRLEYTCAPTSVASGTKNGFGFIDPDTSPPILLAPSDGVDRTTIERCIAFMTSGTTLYAVCGNGSTNHNEVVPGVVLSTSVSLRLKILWKPSIGKVFFFVNDTLTNTISTSVPTTAGVNGLYQFYAGVDGGSGNGMRFMFPKLGIQIN